MSNVRVARRYSRGLFQLAKGDLALAKRRSEMLAPLTELFQNREASRVLRNPVMPPDLKRALLEYALKQGNADETVHCLIRVVVDSGRVRVLPELVKAYHEMLDEAEGLARAHVISAVDLPPEDLRTIGERLGQVLKKKIEVRAGVDKALLGGFVASVGNYRIDLSLRTKLDGLAQSAAGQ